MPQYLEMCRVVSTHGVRGEVKAIPLVDDVPFIRRAKTLYLGAEGAGALALDGVRSQGRMALLHFASVTDLDTARGLVGKTLYFNRDEVRLPKGRVFVCDIVGCRVVDANTGKEYGTVSDVTHPGAQDIYTVKSEDGKEYAFPAVPAFLKKLDIKERLVLVEPIPGLFEDAANGDAP